jgi:hypothetical protein
LADTFAHFQVGNGTGHLPGVNKTHEFETLQQAIQNVLQMLFSV